MTETELAKWNGITHPVDNCPEQVFFHLTEPSAKKTAGAAVFNRKLGLGAYIRYSADNLPILVQWKSMRSHDYTVALEPSNSYIMGRNAERENGTLPSISGYGTLRYRIELGILEGEAEIGDFVSGLE